MKEIRGWNAVGKPTFVYVPADINKFPKYRMAFDIIHEYMNGMIRILDVGCFTGQFVLEARGYGHDAVGCDIQRGLMDMLNKKHGGFFYCNAEELHDCFRNFDVVTMFDSLEHVIDDRKAIAEGLSVLNPYGMLIIHLPMNKRYPDTAHEHMRKYDEEDLKALVPGITIKPCTDEHGQPTMMGFYVQQPTR